MTNLQRNIKIWGFILAILIVAGVAFSPVSGDAPFYLSMARDISNHLVPYRDINLGYTPLVMYLNSVIWSVFGQPPYFVFVIFQYLVILLSAFLLYKIAIQSGLEKNRSVFLGILFSICILSSDGSYINLEVYSILFVLLSYWALLGKKYVAAGFFLGLTFFCKQYGILNFIPFLLLIFYGSDNKIKAIFQFCVGGMVPLVFFLLYYCAIENVAFEALLFQLTGQGYGERSMETSKSIIGFLNGAKVLLLLLVPLVLLRFNPLKDKTQLILTIGLATALLPVFVQHFQHYFLNAFPYAALLIAMNWKNKEWNWPAIQVSLLLVSAFLALRIVNYTEKKSTQDRVAATLRQTYPDGSAIYLKGQTNYLYVLNNYRNPVLKEAGYDYAYKTDKKFLMKYTVLTYDKIPNEIPERILTVNNTKIYEY